MSQFVTPASGLYTRVAPPFREEYRLDVDGRDPQMVLSGTLFNGLSEAVHFAATLAAVGSTGDRWAGPVVYVNPFPSAFLTAARVEVRRTGERRAEFTFDATPRVTRAAEFESPFFRRVELEFDVEEGLEAVLEFDTGTHRVRPADLPSERLSIDEVYRRAGIEATRSGGDSPVSVALAGPDRQWTNAELHDAMLRNWSRSAEAFRPLWAVWTLFAGTHVAVSPAIGPRDLGGIMFDDLGPLQRQGAAVFLGSDLTARAAADPDAAAGARRMAFWCAVHEIGHTFNLLHSFAKTFGARWWEPFVADEPEARSFMNYPDRVLGGRASFFRTFRYRFSDQELSFIRHAPARFVEMGGAAFGVAHAAELAAALPAPGLRLSVRVNRPEATFEALEPVVIELKLTNVSGAPLLVDPSFARTGEGLTLVVRRHGQAAELHRPPAALCALHPPAALLPGASLYDTVFVSVGSRRWLIDEPGRYDIVAALVVGDRTVVSEPLTVQIRPPAGYDENRLAQDYYTPEVGRVLAMDGSRHLSRAVATLREVVERFPDSPAAVHAQVAVALPATRAYKELAFAPGVRRSARIDVRPAEASAALGLADVLGGPAAAAAARTLSHVDYKEYSEQVAAALVAQDGGRAARNVLTAAADTLEARSAVSSVVAGLRTVAAAVSVPP